MLQRDVTELVAEAPEQVAPAAGNATSLLSEHERQTFLEWILGLTGGATTTQEPDYEPAVPAKCPACSEYHRHLVPCDACHTGPDNIDRERGGTLCLHTGRTVL